MITQEEAAMLHAPDLGAVNDFLKSALEMKYDGDVHHYKHVVQQLQERDDPETLWRVYLGLSSCLPLLQQRPDCYQDLVRALFSFNWVCEKRVAVAFSSLLGKLVTANAVYLIPALEMIVKAFILQIAGGTAQHMSSDASGLGIEAGVGASTNIRVTGSSNSYQASSSSSVSSSGGVGMGVESDMSSVHRTLQGLMTLVPTGQAELFVVIEKLYPHKRWDKDVQTYFITQLLQICEYLPVMQPRILDIIIKKSLEIDVEIVVEEGKGGEDGEVKIEAQTLDDDSDIFQFDHDEDDRDRDVHGSGFSSMSDINRGAGGVTSSIPVIRSSNQYPSGSEQRGIPIVMTSSSNAQHSFSHQNNHQQFTGPGEGRQRIASEVIEMADKLDAMLFHMIRFIDRQIQRGHDEKSRILFQLVAIFEDRIMNTHKSKFVQYILFYTAMKVERFSYMLCERLLQIFKDTSVSHVSRQSCVMYLASFCARGAFLSDITINAVLDHLLCWADTYVTNPTGTGNGTVAETSIESAPTFDHTSQVMTRFSTNVSKISTSMEGSTDDSGDGDDFDDLGVQQLTGSDETFTTCIQAMCYMMCFLGKGVAIYHRNDVARRACWERVLACPLSPLARCSFTVRSEFYRLAENSELLARPTLQHLARTPNLTTAQSLDNFFPYDPCLLSATNSTICHSYRSWIGK
jgi:hypothetical protein